jgi:hypothetical protein
MIRNTTELANFKKWEMRFMYFGVFIFIGWDVLNIIIHSIPK